MFVLNISAWRLHPCKPNFHSPCMNVALVRGRTTTQNRKSVTARLTTNTFGVVLRDFSFQTAINTNAFPQAPSTIREQATRISMVTCRESRGLRENGAFVVSFILRHSGRSAETSFPWYKIISAYKLAPWGFLSYWRSCKKTSCSALSIYITLWSTF